MKRLILGSGSPRRREILTSLGVSFDVHVANADETPCPGEAASAYLDRVVLAKLRAVRAELPNGLREHASGILVADTSVVHEGAILGKPVSVDEACVIVTRLAGATHQVHTRFLIANVDVDGPPRHAETVVTDVTFRSLDPGEANAYARTGEGMDKAGAYAIQGRAAGFVRAIRGSYSNVVGLPACEVVVALRSLGLL